MRRAAIGLAALVAGFEAFRLVAAAFGGRRVAAAPVAALWIGLPAAALLALDGGELLLLLAVVFVGDAGAFFVGRVIGGPKLAPKLSPGKTWAGLAGQLLCGAGAAAVAGAPLLLGVLLSLAAALGDLFESGWKRAAGRKDSGRLIPGHGGLLDRVDGLLFAALALGPARALLAG